MANGEWRMANRGCSPTFYSLLATRYSPHVQRPHLHLDAGAGAHREVEVSPLVRRIVAGNPSPYTFTGTCSYIVGRGRVAILDPGPDLPGHVAALLNAVRGEKVTHIVVSHTHRDHSPASRAIKAATGAPIVGCSPHHSARPLAKGERNV